MRVYPFLLVISTFVPLACRTSDKQSDEGSLVKSSGRNLSVDDSQIDGLSFNFCPDKRSMSLVNNMWLNYLSANSYVHFGVSAPKYEELGFGEKGDGIAFRRQWFELRLKRIKEKLIDADDKWKTEAEREQIYDKVLAQYNEEFGKEFSDDGKKAAEFQAEMTSGKDLSRKMIFLSSVTSRKDGTLAQNTTQVSYLEHSKLDFSVITFRGTETDESADVIADITFRHKEIAGLGQVHTGFNSGYLSVRDPLLKILEEKSKDRPLRLWITGHSLGAALSTIMTADIMLRKSRGELNNVELIGNYNIGSPRIGDSEFAKNFDELANKQKVSFIRFRNHQDLVTGVPTGVPGTSGFWHVGALGYYDANGKLFYGDGWKEIETKSDIGKSMPIKGGDHSSIGYFQLAKKALLANPGSPAASCGLNADDRPVRPFSENPKTRGSQTYPL